MENEVMDAILRLWPQWVAVLIVCLLSISLGMVAGWTSPYLAKLTSEGSPLPITHEQASWVASLMPLGRLFGAVAGSIAFEYLGSKTSLLLTGLPLIIGWICIICANSATWLYVSRIFSGTAMGMIFSCFPLYVGEISAPSIRGALVGVVINGMPLGTLIGNIMGPNMSMMWFGIISLIPNLCYVTIFPFLPQSPHYFVRQDDLNRADVAIRWYTRRCDAGVELEAIENFVRSSRPLNFRGRLQEIMRKKNRRAFVTIILLFFFMQLSGVNSIVFYMEMIVRKARVMCMPASTVVIIVNTVGIMMGWLGVYAMDRCGRRILLVVSSCGVIVAMAMLGLHFALLDRNFSPGDLEWLPILALIIFMLMCVGLVPVPSTMLSELFPADLKSTAGFIGSATSATFAFAASKTYQPLVDLMAVQYVFWIYGTVMIVCLVYSATGILETKGKTLQEIQEMLTRQSPDTNEEENDRRSTDIPA